MKPNLPIIFVAKSGVCCLLLLVGILGSSSPVEAAEARAPLAVGVAEVDITPEQPIRLSGYSSRTEPAAEVAQRLRAKALAIGSDARHPSVLITLDAIGIPRWLTDALAERLGRASKVDRAHLAVCATHSHSAPHLTGVLPHMFLSVLEARQQEAIDAYTDRLLDKLEMVALQALKNRRPGYLDWGQGTVGFAVNRRVLKDGKWTGFGVQVDGPVDHSLPVMRVTDTEGNLLAVLANYACHCTTLGGGFNRVHGDWAGFAQEMIEAKHPGAKALIAIGCGADANPHPRGELKYAEQHGRELADEVERLLKTDLKPLNHLPQGRFNDITLYFDPLPSREEWQKRADENSNWAFLAKRMLSQLDDGQELPRTMAYPVQTWTFGEDLAMVFLAGEVVVDYSIRLKRQFDADRLWINAYANDLPCYIASRRIYPQGGYEVDQSMIFYGKPQRLSPDSEDRIADETLRQLPHTFDSAETRKAIPAPISKDQALATIRVRPGMQVELVAAEPLVMDPVDVAWGPDLKMWVVEMADYPSGIDGQPGGRVRFLEDLDGDGVYDKSTLFLDGLFRPNSVMPWKKGVLVVCVPDIIYAEDTDGDGKADRQEILFSGFEEGNPQHLVAGLQWGLDQWIYVGHGNGAGGILSTKSGKRVNMNGRDLRIRPDTGAHDPQAGQTQYGRNRDDWGNWFGSDNSRPGWHFALLDHYMRRNPHVSAPDAKVALPEIAAAGPVYPASYTLSRLNDYDKVNRFTSACGFIIYRDTLLGDEYLGNSFVCEPVHNLVSRAVLQPKGTSFFSRRAPDETTSEFFASTDNWSRPTSARLGPDGALYIVDMYRFVIEHPEWIPEDWQRKLDLRDGHDKGRIYRVFPKGKRPRTPVNISRLNARQLVAALDTPNGWQRDMIHQWLHWWPDEEAIGHLQQAVAEAALPQARLQALCALDGMDALDRETLLKAMTDSHPGVRRHAVRLCESFLAQSPRLREALIKLARDEDPFVRQQVAYSLGETSQSAAGHALAEIVLRDGEDPHLLAAALSSAEPHVQTLMDTFRKKDAFLTLSTQAIAGLVQTALGYGHSAELRGMLTALARPSEEGFRPQQFKLMTAFVQALGVKGQSLHELHRSTPALRIPIEGTDALFEAARHRVQDDSLDVAERKTAIELLGRGRTDRLTDLQLLAGTLKPRTSVDVQLAAIRRLARTGNSDAPSMLLAGWAGHGPRVRSAILDALLRRRAWIPSLLDEMTQEMSIAKTFDSTRRVMLLNHDNESIRNKAQALFGNIPSDRQGVVDYFRPALALKGDAEKGRPLFIAACASCHKVGDFGRNLGPDLTALSNRSAETMLVAIVDPSRAVEEKYVQYQAETSDGLFLTGVLTEESANAITLLGADGEPRTVLRDNLVSFRSSTLSMMPDGLEEGLDHQAMADLLAFLVSSDVSSVVTADPDGSFHLSAAHAAPSGPSVVFQQDSAALSWISHEDQVVWTARDVKAGRYAIFIDAAVAADYEGRPFILELGEETIRGTVEYTRGLGSFRKRKFGNWALKQDKTDLTIRFHHELPGPHMSLREICLAPAE